jgi:hypothetical protein
MFSGIQNTSICCLQYHSAQAEYGIAIVFTECIQVALWSIITDLEVFSISSVLNHITLNHGVLALLACAVLLFCSRDIRRHRNLQLGSRLRPSQPGWQSLPACPGHKRKIPESHHRRERRGQNCGESEQQDP